MDVSLRPRHWLALGVLGLTVLGTVGAQPLAPKKPAASQSPVIPMNQLGAAAGKQYHGDGLSVIATPQGGRLRCVFQRLEAEATAEGLWLCSTTEGASGERFRVMATAVAHGAEVDRSRPIAGAFAHSQNTKMAEAWAKGTLARTGRVEVPDGSARFIRPGLTEEYSVSVDGVRQDFLVTERPEGMGPLLVELELVGARAEPLVNGARLVLAGSDRKLAYSRLRAVDAAGKELTAQMEVLPSCSGSRKQAAEMVIVVDDAGAVYPVRIDPTFSDEDWVSMGSFPGADEDVQAAAVDGSGNLYIGGAFTKVGDVMASYVAKWNGSSWSALGSGMGGDYPVVYTLAVSGTDLYAGGYFTTAGGIAANRVAKWDGTGWSALGSGMNNVVFALAVLGSDLYAGGGFTAAGGIAASNIAKWNGSGWSALGSGINGSVNALAVSGGDLYAGGFFSAAGGVPANYIAKWNGSSWSALRSGMENTVSALAVSGTDLYAGGVFTTAGGVPAIGVAKWDGSDWSALGSGISSGVSALAVLGSDLYAGGYFHYVARWNGSSWSALGSGMSSDSYPSVHALAVSASGLYAGGHFNTAGGDRGQVHRPVERDHVVSPEPGDERECLCAGGVGDRPVCGRRFHPGAGGGSQLHSAVGWE